jgi:hypothetical protein
MKKVLLCGDSIRFGYQSYVSGALDGVVEVFAPSDSCRYAQHMLRWIHEWKDNEQIPDDIDLVHWNVGLWDVLRIMGDDTFTSPTFYCELLKRLQHRLCVLFPKAKQVFALSTSVLEERYKPPYQRYNKDIESFNELAIETLLPLGVEINDLYSITKNAPKECRSDVTHFYTEQGILLVGGQVVRKICETLNVEESLLKEGSAIVPSLSKEIVGL